MKHLILILLMLTSVAQAQTVPELMETISSQTVLFKSAAAAQFCKENLQRWREPSYRENMLALGEAWKTKPEAAYFVINACQSMWTSKYFQPVQVMPAATDTVNSQSAWYLPMLNFLHGAVYLPTELFIFSKVRNAVNPNIPPAPYEIMIGMASSEREVDEVVNREMRDALKIVASVGGGLATALTRAGKIPKVAGNIAARAGSVAKVLLIATVIGYAAGEVFDNAAWYSRHRNLKNQVIEIQNKIVGAQGPTPVLVDEYFQAVRLLGYFYSYAVYLNENQLSSDYPVMPEPCTMALRQYFQEKATNENARVLRYTNTHKCTDAVVLWLQASLFLKSRFAGNAQVELVSARLEEQAAITFRAYEEAWAFQARQLKCDYVFEPVLRMRCSDPATGAEVI